VKFDVEYFGMNLNIATEHWIEEQQESARSCNSKIHSFSDILCTPNLLHKCTSMLILVLDKKPKQFKTVTRQQN
jgi:hypothetical protein